MISVAPRQTPVPIQYVVPILQELEGFGHQRLVIFEQVGIKVLSESVKSDSLTLPALEFTRLYTHALSLLEAGARKSEEHRVLSKDDLEMMCSLAISCSTLHSAIDRVSAFCKVAGGFMQLEVVDAETAQLKLGDYKGKNERSSLILTLAAMIFFHQIFSWMIGRRIPLSALSVALAEPMNPVSMADVLEAPIAFNQGINAIIFDAEYLDMPVVRSYADLKYVVDYMPFDLWYSGHGRASFDGRIRIMLMSALNAGLPMMSISQASQVLHMSSATLSRRLREEGTSYSAIKAGCQREFAEYLLRCTDEPVEHIAVRVGFLDDRAFRRAFRQWTGQSPSEYRSIFYGPSD